MERRIFVTVQDGRAEVCEDTVPVGVQVEILDFDYLRMNPKGEMSCWSKDLREYWLANHRTWGRCETGCPCTSLSGASDKVYGSIL